MSHLCIEAEAALNWAIAANFQGPKSFAWLDSFKHLQRYNLKINVGAVKVHPSKQRGEIKKRIKDEDIYSAKLKKSPKTSSIQ